MTWTIKDEYLEHHREDGSKSSYRLDCMNDAFGAFAPKMDEPAANACATHEQAIEDLQSRLDRLMKDRDEQEAKVHELKRDLCGTSDFD